MRRFNGSSDYLPISPALPSMAALTLSIWLRTTTATALATPIGWQDGALHAARLFLNSPSANGCRFLLRSGALQRVASFINAALFDGAAHHVAWQRAAATGAVRAWLDGVEQSVTTSTAALDGSAFQISREPCLGAMDTNGTLTNYFAGDVGEVCVYNAEITEPEIRELAAGYSPWFHDVKLPVMYFPGGGLGRSIIPTGSITPIAPPGPATVEHPCIHERQGWSRPVANGDRLGGYDVFVRAGSPPAADVDVPAARLARDAVTLSMPQSVLTPGGRNFVGVVPFNLSGYSDEMTVTEIALDDEGEPQLYPQPVTALRANARAGGVVEITWEYDEPDGALIADEFVFAIESLDGLTVDQPDAVPFEELRREYYAEVALADGAYRVRVYSSRDGVYDPHVTGVDVRADGTPPAVVSLPLTIV